MNVAFDHQLLSSFYLWSDDRLNYFSEAYEGPISQVFEYYDSVDIPLNYNAFYCPYRQLVSASDKINVNNYVNIEGNQVFDKDGIYIDYNQGRILVDRDVHGDSTTLSITGDFAYKTVNVYTTDETEENIILNTDFLISPSNETYLQSRSAIEEKTYTIPAVFLTLANSENYPFAFGGLDETKVNIRAVVISESNYILDGILSSFRDSARVSVPLIDFEDFPYGEFSHVKTHPYNYSNTISNSTSSSFIDNVRVSKINDRATERITSSKDFKIGFIDFSVSKVRNPRIFYKR